MALRSWLVCGSVLAWIPCKPGFGAAYLLLLPGPCGRDDVLGIETNMWDEEREVEAALSTVDSCFPLSLCLEIHYVPEATDMIVPKH